MKLIPLPAVTDHRIWRLHDARHALVVDPDDAQAVLEVLPPRGMQLEAILVTHHRPGRALASIADHCANVDEALLRLTRAALRRSKNDFQ